MTATRAESSPTPRSATTRGRGGKPTRYVRESVSEMRKVLWPSRSELVTYAAVVIVFVVIMVALVAGLDIGFARLIVLLFS